MGKAAELARKHFPGTARKVRPMRGELEEGILSSIPNTKLNGHKPSRTRRRYRLRQTQRLVFNV